MNEPTPRISQFITIVGPTASGKTSLAIELAKRFDGEIICADSRTIYRRMNIGTAKPTRVEQKQVPHWGLNLVEPGQSYSVAQFKHYAVDKISEIQSRHKLAILVGGSGLYIDSVLFNYQFRGANNQYDYSSYSDEKLQKLACETYPEGYATIDIKNRRRVEQLLALGPVDSSDRQELKMPTIIIGISINSSLLKQNIAKRAQSMLNNKLIQEVEELRSHYGHDCLQLRTTGYAAVSEYLDKKIPKSVVKESIINQTTKLAKKQLTWFHRNPHVYWIEQPTQSIQLVEDFLS